jgi:hypothetical protein
MVFLITMLTTADVNIHALIAKYGIVLLEIPIIKSGGLGIPLTGLISPRWCAYAKPAALSYVVVFFMFNELRCEVVVRIVGIVDHHC